MYICTMSVYVYIYMHIYICVCEYTRRSYEQSTGVAVRIMSRVVLVAHE